MVAVAEASGAFDVHTVARGPIARSGHHPADLLDAAQRVQLLDSVRPSHLLHVAWYVAPGAYWTASENDAWADASESLFARFFAGGGTRLLGVGTSAEYDWRFGDLSESAPLEGTTPYGISKRRAFEAAAATAARHDGSAAWARLFMVYGPAERPDRFVPTMIRAMLEGARARCSPADAERDFIHVRDVAAALLAIISSDIDGPVNVGSGVGTTLRHVVETLQGIIPSRAVIDFEGGGGDHPRVVADAKRLRDEVGFRPGFGLEEGLADAVAWWSRR